MKGAGSSETSKNSYQITSNSAGVSSHFKNRVTASLSGVDTFKFQINRTTVRRTLVFCEHLRSKLLISNGKKNVSYVRCRYDWRARFIAKFNAFSRSLAIFRAILNKACSVHTNVTLRRFRRAQWPRCLRHGSASARLLGLRVPPEAWMWFTRAWCVMGKKRTVCL